VGHNLEPRSCQARAMGCTCLQEAHSCPARAVGHNSLQEARSYEAPAEGSQVRPTRLQGPWRRWRHRNRLVMLGVARSTLQTH
jgi:hypothetical protein